MAYARHRASRICDYRHVCRKTCGRLPAFRMCARRRARDCRRACHRAFGCHRACRRACGCRPLASRRTSRPSDDHRFAYRRICDCQSARCRRVCGSDARHRERNRRASRACHSRPCRLCRRRASPYKSPCGRRFPLNRRNPSSSGRGDLAIPGASRRRCRGALRYAGCCHQACCAVHSPSCP